MNTEDIKVTVPQVTSASSRSSLIHAESDPLLHVVPSAPPAEEQPLSSPPNILNSPYPPPYQTNLQSYQSHGSFHPEASPYQVSSVSEHEAPPPSYDSLVPQAPPITTQPRIPTAQVSAAAEYTQDSALYVNPRPDLTQVTLGVPGSYDMNSIVWGPWDDVEKAKKSLKEPYKNLMKGTKGDHWLYLLGHAVMISGIVVIVWQYKREEPDMSWIYGFAFFIVVGYFIAIAEWCSNNTFEYLNSAEEGEEVVKKQVMLRKKAPVVKWTVECYHYSDYNRGAPDVDRPSDKPSDWEKRKDKIVSYMDTKYYHFKSCVDITGKPNPYGEQTLTKIISGTTIGFKSQSACNEYMASWQRFCDENKARDHYMDTTQDIILDGLQEYFLATPSKSPGTVCTDSLCYVGWCCCLCAPCYRLSIMVSQNKQKRLFLKVVDV